MDKPGEPISIKQNVLIAADFIRNASYNDEHLRKYLIETRGLTVGEVDKAFALNRRRQTAIDSEETKLSWSSSQSHQITRIKSEDFKGNCVDREKGSRSHQSGTKRNIVDWDNESSVGGVQIKRVSSAKDLALRIEWSGSPTMGHSPVASKQKEFTITEQHEPSLWSSPYRNLDNCKIDQRFSHVSLPSTTPSKSNTSIDRDLFTEKSKKPLPKKLEDSLVLISPSKTEAGSKLINNFLRTENNYCIALQCLRYSYYKELIVLAEKCQIEITCHEINKMFEHISHLHKFHKAFYSDMNQGCNIGWMFIRLIAFFKRYIHYVSVCNTIVKTMREYLYDKKLHKALRRIRLRSARKEDDMTDLLLVPLDRINHYQEFLDQLYNMSDDRNRVNATLLIKATRRIGRIAKFVNYHKVGILERNEMNKVQQFLGRQFHVLTPNRKILRRGRIVRRTSGWSARKKHNVLFLFNDLLLWTTRKGKVQNAVTLRKCMLMPSSAKKEPERKFQITVSLEQEQKKTLLVEVKSKEQKEHWWNVITRALAELNVDKGGLAKVDEQCDLLVQEDVWDQEITTRKTPIIERVGSTPSSTVLEASFEERFETSHNYPVFKEMDETVDFDDVESQVSDSDGLFYKHYHKYVDLMKSITSTRIRRHGKTTNPEEAKQQLGRLNDNNTYGKDLSPTKSTSSAVIRRAIKLGDETSNESMMNFSDLSIISLGDEKLVPKLVSPARPPSIHLRNLENGSHDL